MILRLRNYKQFAHCSSEKLHALLRKAGVSVTVDRVKSVINDSNVCQRFGRALPRPVVGLPLAQEWNHTVSLDLHEVSGSGHSLWYLHMINVFSRFSVEVFITNKRPTTTINEFFRNWCLSFGYPKAVLTDNGGEFDNADFHSFTENADIVIKTTAAYSPWSKGVVERHNAVLTDMFNRLISDDSLQYDRETALKTAVFAKNSMLHHDGLSPYQIAFGCGPRLPSICTNQPPALECTTTSESVSKLLFKLNDARRFFIEADSSNRIKRALKSNVRYDNGPFVLGDRVFYKRESDDRWKAPAIVIGQDGAVVYVRQGGKVCKVHHTKLRFSVSNSNSSSSCNDSAATSDDLTGGAETMTSFQVLSDVPASASPDCDSSDEEKPVVESTLHSQLPIPDIFRLTMNRFNRSLIKRHLQMWIL